MHAVIGPCTINVFDQVLLERRQLVLPRDWSNKRMRGLKPGQMHLLLSTEPFLRKLRQYRGLEFASWNEELKRKMTMNYHEALKLQLWAKEEQIILVQDLSK